MKFYKKNGFVFWFRNINSAMIIICLVMIVFSVKSLLNYNMESAKNFNDWIKLLSPLWIIVAIFFLNFSIKKVEINPHDKSLKIKNIFNLFNKTYEIKFPVYTKVITNIKGNMVVDNDIYLQTKNEMTKIHTLSKGKIEPFLNETMQIFNDGL